MPNTSLVSRLSCAPIQEFDAITSRIRWLEKSICCFQPHSKVDVDFTIYKIQRIMEKDPSVLKQSMFVTEVLEVVNKLDSHVYSLCKNDPSYKNNRCSYLIFSLEGYVLTRISGDQTKDPEVMQLIKSRLTPENVMPYLIGTNFSQNITLATACCSFIEENKNGLENLIKYLIKKPEQGIALLNAGCLAKNDLVIKTVWDILYLNKNFEIFKIQDKRVTYALDYLIDKKKISNHTLLVGDLQNPKEILVNREILFQRNEYFQRLFQKSFSERASTIALKNLQSTDYDGFLCLLRYIYTGKIDVPLELCPQVSSLAEIYLEPDLKKACDLKNVIIPRSDPRLESHGTILHLMP
jgi:hypothetical protein